VTQPVTDEHRTLFRAERVGSSHLALFLLVALPFAIFSTEALTRTSKERDMVSGENQRER